MAKVAPWSFSKIKDFQTCPKQFYHKHVLKQFPFKETPEMRYGTEFHKAAELYVKEGKPVPSKFEFAQPQLEALSGKPGDKHCELKFGITEDLEPCSFFATNVWFRGIVDLAIVDDTTAWIIDYKTGKSSRYADSGQLELMALCVFKHFPQVETIKAGLLFVIPKEFVRESYPIEEEKRLWRKWLGEYGKMATAAEKDVWNPKPSGLCRAHCPVTECPHNGAN